MLATACRLLAPHGITCYSWKEADFPESHHAWCYLALPAVETSSQGRRQEIYGVRMREALSAHGAAKAKKSPCRIGHNSNICEPRGLK